MLDNPELLTTIPYEEMKTLALAYPYAHNLRYLLALKARQDDHPDAGRMLSTAAVYSLDRTQLFYLTAVKVPVFQPVAIAAEDAILELMPIEVVQRELEARAPQPRNVQVETTASREAIGLPPDPGTTSPPLPSDPAAEPGEQVGAPSPPAPVLSQPFALWISSFNPPLLVPKARQAPETAALATKEKPVPAPTAQELAERSLAENKDVISETLARLLAKQGYRDKAIDMYERLRLAFPEKSAYFAAEIEKLKK